MPPIRTLLWIGPSDELARLGVLDTPTLDVVWVADPSELDALPPLALDAIVLGGADAPLETALEAMARLRARRLEAPVMVLRRALGAAEPTRLETAGARRVLALEPDGPERPAPRDPSPVLIAALESMLAREPNGGRRVAASAQPAGRGPALIGRSRAIAVVESGIRCAARSSAPVLVVGETGSGKEIVARRIHAQSRRSEAAFVAVNCAAFVDTLLESELFGHRRGAFTGADRDRIGLFERADGGTVFLDEIGETSAALQARLLRVLQEREVLPVGADRARRVDVRVVAATHRDLGHEIETGRFREDLYYRLAVLQVALPPLRERRADVGPLAEHFLEVHGAREHTTGCRLSPRALRLLEEHDWPGNVRELENEIRRALALADPGELITARRLSPTVRGERGTTARRAAPGARPGPRVEAAETLQQALDRIEGTLIRDALAEHEGRRARTARRLGVTREGLYN